MLKQLRFYMNESFFIHLVESLGWLEGLAVVFNIAYVVLATRRSTWCWPFGILASVLSVFLFFSEKLYAESGLFLFYILIGFYGWWQWRTNKDADGIDVVTRNAVWHFKILLLGWLITFLLGWLLERNTDSFMPYLDACTTVFAVIATWLTTRRVLANWVYWIAINALSIYLYQSKELFLYAALAFFFTAMSIYGYAQWRRAYELTISTRD